MRTRSIVAALLPLVCAGCLSAPPPVNLPDARSIGFDGARWRPIARS